MIEGFIHSYINPNGVLVGVLGALVGYWFGFRTNLWLARRNDWNAIADQIRKCLLLSKRDKSFSLLLDDAHVDSFIQQAGWLRRRQIEAALSQHQEIFDNHQIIDAAIAFTPEQVNEMERLRERLLSLSRRR